MGPSSPSSADPSSMFIQPRGVRLPNELLREMAQCVPMAWFVVGSEQHRHEGIVQLGTALSTYLAQAGGKFAAVAKRNLVVIMSDQQQHPESPPPTFQETFQNPGDGLGNLPEGWVCKFAPNGRRIFGNTNDGTTTWDDPRLAATADEDMNPEPAVPGEVDMVEPAVPGEADMVEPAVPGEADMVEPAVPGEADMVEPDVPGESSGSRQVRKYTVEEKVDMIDYAKYKGVDYKKYKEVGNSAAGREFGGVDESTIRGWRKMEDELREKAETTPGCTQYFERVHAELIGAIDNDLVEVIGKKPKECWDWYEIAAKAKELWKERAAQDEMMKESDMNITMGWVSRFMRRNQQRLPEIAPTIIPSPKKMSTGRSGSEIAVRKGESNPPMAAGDYSTIQQRQQLPSSSSSSGAMKEQQREEEVVGEAGSGSMTAMVAIGDTTGMAGGSGGVAGIAAGSGGVAAMVATGGTTGMAGGSGSTAGMPVTECTGAKKRKWKSPMKIAPSPKQQKGGDEEKQQTQ